VSTSLFVAFVRVEGSLSHANVAVFVSFVGLVTPISTPSATPSRSVSAFDGSRTRAAFGVDIQLGFGAGTVVVADTIEVAIEIEFTISGSDLR